MSDPTLHHKITYIEFTTPNIEQTRRFYTEVFGWQFQNWGADYLGFDGIGVKGGFAKGDPLQTISSHAPVIVLYSSNLEATESAILAAGGSIVVPTFTFPGGRRFHFSDGAGNVLGVWSE
jgi:predicted enzyme related to lactoylglutathione lyase